MEGGKVERVPPQTATTTQGARAGDEFHLGCVRAQLLPDLELRFRFGPLEWCALASLPPPQPGGCRPPFDTLLAFDCRLLLSLTARGEGEEAGRDGRLLRCAFV